jgi:hypothetical protein
MSSSVSWLWTLWEEQAINAALYFNVWGYAQKALLSMPSFAQIIGAIKEKDYGFKDIFTDGDPDKFLDHFDYKDFLLSEESTGTMRAFLIPEFSAEITRLFESTEHSTPLIGIWIFHLFAIYTHINPEKIGVEKCLALTHNAQKVYNRANWFLFGLEVKSRDYARTSKANTGKKETAQAVVRRIQELAEAKDAESPRFAGMPNNRRAEILYAALNKEDISTSVRTIRRILAKRTSGQK